MRAAALILALAGGAGVAVLAAIDPRGALDGWRAAFLWLSSLPIGAVALLLIAGVVGADWDAALKPLLPAVPWLALAGVPVAIGQALFHWPAGHLHLWLSPPLFVARSAVALLFWTLVARALGRGPVARPGPLLFAHAALVSVMGYDWILAAAPGQPQSAAPMVLATMQIGGASAIACAAGLGRPEQRRDLAYLLVASALGLAYLLYMNFAIVWFGNLPSKVGWFADRYELPGSLLPGAALLLGLIAPALLVGLGWSDPARRRAGALALAALALVCAWQVAPGWIALGAAVAGIAAAGGLVRGLRA